MKKIRFAQENTHEEHGPRLIDAIPELLVSVRRAAKLLGVSRRTIYLLLASGDLRRGKVRRRTMIHRDDIIQFAAKCLIVERET